MQQQRRGHLGPAASAALPPTWKALARLGWSRAHLARELGISGAQVTRILYGDRTADRRTAVRMQALLGVSIALWDKACPANWRPHDYPDLRRRPAAARPQATGTDG